MKRYSGRATRKPWLKEERFKEIGEIRKEENL